MNALPYRAPIDDLVFVLTEFLRIQDRQDLEGFDVLDADGIRDFVTEAARFHEEVLAPISLPGDAEGARLDQGRVVTPAGFPETWGRYREAGWPFVSVPAELGGGGLPPIMSAVISELRMSTAHSFAMYGAFCAASATMIGALGAPWMRDHIAPRLATGEWTATMCLTESHAGSDLPDERASRLVEVTGEVDAEQSRLDDREAQLAAERPQPVASLVAESVVGDGRCGVGSILDLSAHHGAGLGEAGLGGVAGHQPS